MSFIVGAADDIILVTSKIYALPPNLPPYPDISRLELILLVYLLKNERPHSLKDLVMTFKMSKQQMSKMVSRLEERGWLSKKPQPDDRRGLFIGLSEEGKKRMKEIQEIRLARFEKETSSLSDKALIEIADHFMAIGKLLHKD